MPAAATAAPHLGIDLGTSSVKTVLTSPDGQVLASASAGYDVATPQPGWAETDPQQWWDAVVDAVGRLGAQTGGGRLRDVATIGLSGQMHGVVLLDADAQPLRPAILHVDRRASSHLATYRALPVDVRERLANPLAPGMAGPLLAWLADHEPETLRRARWAVQPKDWLRAVLTGQVATEPSDASATLLYDVTAEGWALDVADRLQVPGDLLAPLLPWSGAPAGTVTADAADDLGLPRTVVVAAGGADTAVAALGSGLLDGAAEPGAVSVTIGSGAQVITLRRDLPPAQHRRDPLTHLYRTAAPRGWYAMAAVPAAGLALDWGRRMLGASWPELYDAGPPRADAPLFLPHLAGQRTPHSDPDPRGAWTQLALHHTRTDLLAAVVEGVVFALADALDALPQPQPSRSVPLRLAGGGSTSPLVRQLLADATGRPVAASALADASACGAALLGALAGDHIGLDDLARRSLPLGDVVEPSASVTQRQTRRLRYQATGAALRS